MKTYSPKPEHIERRWYVLDAGEQVLGRVATEAAVILRGKHKPIFAPHMDVGDYVIIINASKVVLTGGKESRKIAWRHSGHPGGITGTLYEDLLAKKPAFAVEKAVRGMLPKNRLGRAMIKKLHVVPGPEHHHQAQKPVDWAMGTRPAWEGIPAPSTVQGNDKKKTSTKKAAAQEPDVAASGESATAKKATAAKATAAKTTTQKTPAKKPTAAKTTTRKKTAAKTTAARKTTGTKKPTATKATARKAATKKPAATSTRKKKET
ncbi:MAG: 50S ribosomal protein L13 [Actinobacteria bacterium]|nr:50S ribosomal protein L13 [Actinomycetota bacterium]